jgi:hypothetical protein
VVMVKTMGTMMVGMSEEHFTDIVAWLLKTMQS